MMRAAAVVVSGAVFGTAASLAACHASSVVIGELEEVTALRAMPNPDLDLLFVIDNTVSMAQNQAALAASFPRMIEVLEHLDGGLPNLHIGVITADLGTLGSGSDHPGPPVATCEGRGDDGALQSGAAQLAGSFIVDVAGPGGMRMRNYAGELRDVFAALTQLPLDGCGFEQPLAAIRRALDNPANAGFVRPGANLAVVIVSDEDDCSARDPALFGPTSPELGELGDFRCTRHGVACTPDDTAPGPKADCSPRAASPYVEDVQPFVDALLAAKPDPRMLLVAAIAGDPSPFVVGESSGQVALVPSCELAGPAGRQTAAPAVRISAFLDAFPGRAQRTSLCAVDLSAPLGDIGYAAKKLVGDPCLVPLRALTDASSDPGLQPACTVLDVRDAAPADPRPIPACEPGTTDCFEILPDAARCPTAPDHLRVQLRRSTAVADDTWTHVRCQVEP